MLKGPPPPLFTPWMMACSDVEGSPATPKGSENVTPSEKSSAGVESGTFTFPRENVPNAKLTGAPLASVKTSNELAPTNVSPYVESVVESSNSPQPLPKQPCVEPWISVIDDADAGRANAVRLTSIRTARITLTDRLVPLLATVMEPPFRNAAVDWRPITTRDTRR